MAIRLDKGTLSPPRRLDSGRLVVDARLSRTGVMTYRNPDGSPRIEYRSPTEVFKADSKESFALVPVTMDHPPVMVTAENAHEYTVGQVGENIREDGMHLVATLVINHAAAIKAVEAGKREVSCGYTCDLDETPGVSPEGQRYDARQYNIRGNHLAIVDAGRAGTSAIKFDALEQVSQPEESESDPRSPKGEPTGQHNDTENTVDELKKALAEVVEQTKRADAASKLAGEEKARADAADQKVKETELKLASIESEKASETKRADAEKVRADNAEKSRKDADDAFASKVAARVALEGVVVAALGRNDKGEVLSVDGKGSIDIAKMTDRDLRCVAVEKLDGIKIDEKRGDEAVAYAFDLAQERAKKSGEALGTARQTIVEGRNDASGTDIEAAAKARMLARRNKKETK